MKTTKILQLFILLSISINTFAQAFKVAKFTSELSKNLLIDLTHIERVADQIRIKKASGLQLVIMNRMDAEATYNDFTNLILLRPKNFVGERVISYSDLPEGQRYTFYVLASTIFHELLHADFDVYIENSNEEIKNFINGTLKRWFKTNFSKYNEKIATHELFGYTAGDSVLAIHNQISDILTSHGLNYITGKCFPPKALARIAQRLKLDESLEFKMIKEDYYFYSRNVPDYVFVKGQALDLKSKGFPDSYRQVLYKYFEQQYDMPETLHALTDRMNKSHYYEILKNCYAGILNTTH